MSFSLESLKPKIIDVRIVGDGEDIVLPILPLTYIEWNNAAIGVDIPSPPKERLLVDGKQQDVEDVNNPDYQQKYILARNTIDFRRLAVALAGGGAIELQGKTLDEQVVLLQDMDTGITNALVTQLAKMARSKRAERFQAEPISENGNGDLQSAEVVGEILPESI